MKTIETNPKKSNLINKKSFVFLYFEHFWSPKKWDGENVKQNKIKIIYIVTNNFDCGGSSRIFLSDFLLRIF